MFEKYTACIGVLLSINIALSIALTEPQLKNTIYPFQNVSLSWDERVDDLVSRLTVIEIIDQLGSAKYSGQAPGIPRLNILPYNFINECLRGIVRLTKFLKCLSQIFLIFSCLRFGKIQLPIHKHLD